MKKSVLSILILFFTLSGFSQRTDSLWSLYKNTKNDDTTRLSALYELAWDLLYTNPDSTYILGEKHLQLAFEKKLRREESKALNTIGASYQMRGNYVKAIDSYQKCLKIMEELGDTKGIASAMGNIGSLYIDLKEFKKALGYQMRCLKLVQQIGNIQGVASALNNICIIYTGLKDYDQAISYAQKSLDMYNLLKDDYGIASANANIGNLYFERGMFSKCVPYQIKALELANKGGYNYLSINTGAEIGNTYHNLKRNDIALKYLKDAEKLLEKDSDPVAQMAVSSVLSEVYQEMGKYKEAFRHFEISQHLRDSLYRGDVQKELTQKELQAEFDKKLVADSLKNADEKKVTDALIFAKNTQIEKDRIQKIALYGGLLLLIVGGTVMYNRFRIIRRQKEIIEAKNKETEEQKIIIEEKQKEILSSISYAKRLQEAILPPMSQITENLAQSFILYKPKDIVAGDFYWIEVVSKDYILIAAADCTGHGVPGALVSVVCSNALNRTVKEFEITDPGKILDKTRELVVETFERSETEVKDGMDISLCLLNKKTNEIDWAGANNPLWIVREGKIIEFKPNKQAIGKVDKPLLYQTHKVKLQKDDNIYIFTDGYADQFGGPNGKKFKYHQLVELMITISAMPIAEQKIKLETEFHNWKGNLEQVDDVCVIGIKV
ncbi:MAG: tetratricopeptide repeat protein [Sphingobacteriaceae bacterium]|nr:tetratricopeptide repeat protein [Sphingobacteriaceae bacterium]